MSFEYMQAAKAVRRVITGEASSKNAIFNSDARNLKRVYALVTETLKRRDALEAALKKCKLLSGDVDTSLLLVLAYERFYGARKIKGGGQVKRVLLEREADMRRALGLPEVDDELTAGGSPLTRVAAELAMRAGRMDSNDKKPRWLRVNTLKASIAEVIARLTAPAPSASADGSGAHATAALPASSIEIDPSVPTVLRLPPDAHVRLSLHHHPLVTSGAVVLQDLASAMPVTALLDAWNWRTECPEGGTFDAIDCCAAPGNKTTQLAAAMSDLFASNAAEGGQRLAKKARKGWAGEGAPAGQGFTVHAFDRDPARVKLLHSRVLEAGAASIVQCTCADFLACNTADPAYARVKVIVLDPSCSGSGMDPPASVLGPSASSSAPAFPPVPSDQQTVRVRNLSTFQARALSHALSFPALKRLVYSTCSLYAEEDERVVAGALAAYSSKGASGGSPVPGRTVFLMKALPNWKRRGVPGQGLTAEQADACVRCHPVLDNTTGFFLAVFRVQDADAS